MAAEKREQVFISSTYLDLQEERQAIIKTLLEADCLPAGMELFPASDDEKWELIKRVIDDSDYYIVVIGGRYGSVDDAGLSFTEREFDYADEVGKPVLGFLHGEPGKIPGEKLDLDADARARLDEFRTKVSKRMVKFWTSPGDLAGSVALSLIQIRKIRPAEGWVRARDAITPEVEKEIAELRERVATLTQELGEAKITAMRPEVDDDVARGDDIYKMAIYTRYWTKADTDAGRTFASNARHAPDTVEISWDQLFSEVGPLMLDEVSEKALDEALDRVAYLWAPDPPKLPKGSGSWDEIEAADEVLQDVKVQFFTLGYITQSEKRHHVQDTNAYWSLTSAGRDHLMRLRAIRKSDIIIDNRPESGKVGPEDKTKEA